MDIFDTSAVGEYPIPMELYMSKNNCFGIAINKKKHLVCKFLVHKSI